MTFATGSSTGQTRASCSPKPRSCRLIVTVAFSLCVFPPVVHSTVYMAHQCGRTIRSAGDMIFSQGGLYYTSNTNCTVTIETLNNEGFVLLQFTEIDLKSNENCTDDYIELTHVRGKDSLGHDVTTQIVCGGDAPKEVVSIGSFLRIHLISDGRRNGRGWSGVFTTVISSGGSLCLGHDRYRCGNGHCIASSLRCDSVNHCGDASDETGSCQDDLPEYIGQVIFVDGRKALYVVLGIIFTVFFVCICTVQCIRDTVIKIQRRIKIFMKSRKKKKDETRKPITPEDELRQTLMASLYDRRASQPYEVTLNTITGGELARQLKLQLQQNMPESNVRRASETADGPDSVKVINFQSKRSRNRDERMTDNSEVLSLLQNESHDTNSDSWEFDYSPGLNLSSEKSGSTKSIPSVIVSEDGDENYRLVVFDPNENPAELLQNTEPKTSPSKTPVSRFQVSTVPESKVSSKKVSSTSSSSDMSTPSKSRFSVRSKSEQPSSGKGTAVSFSPTKSRFAVTVVDETKDDKGVSITNQRSKDVPPATGRFLEVPRVRRGSGEQKSETLQVPPPKASRFTVQKIEEDEKSEPKAKNIFEKLESQTHRITNRDYTKQVSEPNTLTSPFEVVGDNTKGISKDGNVITTSVTVHGFPGFIETHL